MKKLVEIVITKYLGRFTS